MNKAAIAAILALLIANVEASEVMTNAYIGWWVTPNCLFGIIFMLLFFWVCFCTLQALAAVQTPKIMLEKCIDWGKVEKVEE